jgi:hypothetical protein
MFEKHLYLNFLINGNLHPNISLYNEIGENMNKLIINFSEVHFHFVIALPQFAFIKKDYKALDLMIAIKFCTCKKITIKKNLLHQNSQILLKL